LFAAPDYIGPEAGRCRFYCQGLQDWIPYKQTYSIIWVQWVFCYLTDNDAITFLQRCGEALVDGGVVCLKENTCKDTDFVLDRDDASLTRSVPYLLNLAERAGLRVVLQRHQNNFPEEIFPVPMIALEPVTRAHA
jgi:protein N-terminal methyltransferase